jgi:hypothetical protein
MNSAKSVNAPLLNFLLTVIRQLNSMRSVKIKTKNSPAATGAARREIAV